ncbi:hypothetical protein TNCV_1421101 [Trichonephila clavipes]|nr:hypothetical protein TNCV_1421101 [Trichonephila clavipes]
MVDTRVRFISLMSDNDESGAVTADLTINLSSRSAVSLSRHLPSSTTLLLSTHSCQHLLMTASLRLK